MMTDTCDIPHLEVVSVESLMLHEHHDHQRTPSLVERLSESGILRNPPIVLQTSKAENRYIVLDGANRVVAFRKMRMPHIVVQIVHVDEPGLELDAWNHVIWGIQPSDLLESMEAIPQIKFRLERADKNQSQSVGCHQLASVQFPDETAYTSFNSPSNLADRVNILNDIVDSYRTQANIDRTLVCQIESIIDLYTDLSGLAILTPFKIEEVIDLVKAGYLFPPGVTRFKVSPRVLRINYSLDLLKADRTTGDKNEELRKWLQESLERKSVRYYEEATFLFNE